MPYEETMRVLSRRVGGFLLWMFCCTYLPVPAVAIDSLDDPTVSALESSIDDWIQLAEFTCTFKFTEGIATSLEQAARGESSETTILAVGKLCKSADRTLESCRILTAESPGECNVVPGIALKDSRFEVFYGVDEGRILKPTFFISKRQAEMKGLPCPGTSLLPVGPLRMAGGTKAISMISTYRDIAKRDDYHVSMTTDVVDDVHIEVVIDSVGTFESTEHRMRFWTGDEIPVLAEVRTKSVFPDGQVCVSGLRATDRVRCKGIMIPSTIYSYQPVLEEQSSSWLVWRWESEDLGAETPTDEDFVVKFNEDTSISGVTPRIEEDMLTSGLFDLRTFDVSDLDPSLYGSVAGKDVASSSLARKILTLVSMILLLLAGSVLLRRRIVSRRTR